MPESDLEVANDAVRELSKYGLAELQYVTAGFQPYSNAQRPDVVFWPGNGPCQSGTFFVVIRTVLSPTQRLPSPDVLKEQRAFIETEPDDSLHFALATSRTIDQSLYSTLMNDQIEVFDGVHSGFDLAERILEWSKCL